MGGGHGEWEEFGREDVRRPCEAKKPHLTRGLDRANGRGSTTFLTSAGLPEKQGKRTVPPSLPTWLLTLICGQGIGEEGGRGREVMRMGS